MSDYAIAAAVAVAAAFAFAYTKDRAETDVHKAARAYVFGLPIVMTYCTISEYFVDENSGEYKGVGLDTFKHEHRVYSYKDKSVVTPNADTPYSVALVDLRGGPVVLNVPEVESGRYYCVQFIDLNTYNFGYVGSRSTGNEKGSYVAAMAGWKGALPPGAKGVFFSTTPFALVLGRIQLFSKSDMKNVVRIQNGMGLEPLRGNETRSPAKFAVVSSKMVKTAQFWDVLDAALEYVPKTRENAAIMREMGELGIGPLGRSVGRSRALGIGMKLGAKIVGDRTKTIGIKSNGWSISTGGGDKKHYSGNWLDRAAVASIGIYANDAVEAVYPFAMTSADGKPLDGGKSNYTITFDEKLMPPVKAFWSITAYDAKTRLFVKNDVDRYLVNSTMVGAMKKEGGSVKIHLGASSPGKELENNWLPIPPGPAFLVMRLYWPEVEGSTVLPVGRGTWNPPPIVVAEKRGTR